MAAVAGGGGEDVQGEPVLDAVLQVQAARVARRAARRSRPATPRRPPCRPTPACRSGTPAGGRRGPCAKGQLAHENEQISEHISDIPREICRQTFSKITGYNASLCKTGELEVPW
uniref:Uncharacterized protein n=1 Tax=Oryza rufipogon TaxID=4529 RepID=A0A0E0NEV2_ORYRU